MVSVNGRPVLVRIYVANDRAGATGREPPRPLGKRQITYASGIAFNHLARSCQNYYASMPKRLNSCRCWSVKVGVDRNWSSTVSAVQQAHDKAPSVSANGQGTN